MLVKGATEIPGTIRGWCSNGYISMGQCKKDVTPLLAHWSYIFLAPTHRYNVIVLVNMSLHVIHHVFCGIQNCLYNVLCMIENYFMYMNIMFLRLCSTVNWVLNHCLVFGRGLSCITWYYIKTALNLINDYMDPNVRCPKKVVKLTHSLTLIKESMYD